MIIQGKNHFNHSLNKISLKTLYLQRIYIAKFQINDCFENFQTYNFCRLF